MLKKINIKNENFFSVSGYGRCTISSTSGIENPVITTGVGSMAYFCPQGNHPKGNLWITKGAWHPATAFRKGSPMSYNNLGKDTELALRLNQDEIIIES